ncbi:MAG: hypothetical protein LBJ35_00940 [Spirochaetaceae bacterium]|jgi:predicted RNA-binding Zn-ribbon protein involved in translation (DUF1610 family)|nr:hypothetical protein [Spirochaetaceae bacterium]
MKKKKPRFFCDGCGMEVAADEERCPCCGKFFASIRCPSCGFTGEQRVFEKGCPACGYSAPDSKPPRKYPPPVSTPQWAYVASIAFAVMILSFLFIHITR